MAIPAIPATPKAKTTKRWHPCKGGIKLPGATYKLKKPFTVIEPLEYEFPMQIDDSGEMKEDRYGNGMVELKAMTKIEWNNYHAFSAKGTGWVWVDVQRDANGYLIEPHHELPDDPDELTALFNEMTSEGLFSPTALLYGDVVDVYFNYAAEDNPWVWTHADDPAVIEYHAGFQQRDNPERTPTEEAEAVDPYRPFRII